MAFYTTMLWQTSGRLVQKLNVCTVVVCKAPKREILGRDSAELYSLEACAQVASDFGLLGGFPGTRVLFTVES